MSLQPGEAFRRTNWTMSIDRRLDTSTGACGNWAGDRSTIALDPTLPEGPPAGGSSATPSSGSLTPGAVLFPIRTYLLPLTDIAKVPVWRKRMGEVLAELPDDMAEYKGASSAAQSRVRLALVRTGWLANSARFAFQPHSAAQPISGHLLRVSSRTKPTEEVKPVTLVSEARTTEGAPAAVPPKDGPAATRVVLFHQW